MSTYWLSVIIPTLNEEKFIGSTLDIVKEVFPQENMEAIVADGGSGDGTLKIVRQHPGVKIVASAPGRGPQMNRGAEEASGEILLFLHADVRLPPDADLRIKAALQCPRAVGGCFKVRTVIPSDHSRLFRLLVKTADWRSRFTRYPYGDQAVFVKREIFEMLGGFKDYPVMEDFEFSRRLRAAGRIVRADACVEVSGRRWQKNIVKNFLKLKTLPVLFRLGVPPAKLARFYRDVR